MAKDNRNKRGKKKNVAMKIMLISVLVFLVLAAVFFGTFILRKK